MDLGLLPGQLWDLSLNEFRLMAEGYRRRQIESIELQKRVAAWSVASLVNWIQDRTADDGTLCEPWMLLGEDDPHQEEREAAVEESLRLLAELRPHPPAP